MWLRIEYLRIKMKKILVTILLVASTSIFATLPSFTPQNLARYRGTHAENMSRLRVNLTVSSNHDVGEIKISHFTLCSSVACWKAEVNKNIPIVNSSTTKGQLIADVLIANNAQIKAISFAPTTGKQSIAGELSFEKILNIEPEYQGHNLYIILDKRSKENGASRYFPVAASALPFNPELKYYLIDPRFNQSIHLNSKTKITFPSKFLSKPQLFIVSEHNVGKKFPMLDIYPYIKGRGNLKIQLAEVNKKTNISSPNRAITFVNYSEIASSYTGVIQATDTPSHIVK